MSLVFGKDKEDLQGQNKIRSVYDPCCGTGGMLTIGKEWVHKNINPRLSINLYGQELNDVTYAICKSDLLMLDENPENIHGPFNSISQDKLQGKKFDYMITNPPFGVSWSTDKDFVEEEKKRFQHQENFSSLYVLFSRPSLHHLHYVETYKRRLTF